MSDRPIIMSAPMVRATVREIRQPGTGKTETRRIIKPQPPTQEQFPHSGFGLCPSVADGVKMYSQNDYERLPKHPTDWDLVGSVGVARDAGFPTRYRLRYAAGDRLWVREAWAPVSPDEHERPTYECDIWYRSETDAPAPGNWDEVLPNERPRYARWRPSIHMPRWASRITLAVTAVRVERLRDIDDAGAEREGIYERHSVGDNAAGATWTWQSEGWKYDTPRKAYAALWDSLHGEGAWDGNPWVAVIAFTAEQRNIDAPAGGARDG